MSTAGKSTFPAVCVLLEQIAQCQRQCQLRRNAVGGVKAVFETHFRREIRASSLMQSHVSGKQTDEFIALSVMDQSAQIIVQRPVIKTAGVRRKVFEDPERRGAVEISAVCFSVIDDGIGNFLLRNTA